MGYQRQVLLTLPLNEVMINTDIVAAIIYRYKRPYHEYKVSDIILALVWFEIFLMMGKNVYIYKKENCSNFGKLINFFE